MAPETPSASESGTLPEVSGVWPVRVYYEDTDAGGIVYHATYLRFAERARTELLRSLGMTHSKLLAEAQCGFAVRRCDAEFLRPAVLDDFLEIHTAVTEITGASVFMDQIVRRENEVLATLHLRLVCVNQAGRPIRLPQALRVGLAGSRETEHRD